MTVWSVAIWSPSASVPGPWADGRRLTARRLIDQAPDLPLGPVKNVKWAGKIRGKAEQGRAGDYWRTDGQTHKRTMGFQGVD